MMTIKNKYRVLSEGWSFSAQQERWVRHTIKEGDSLYRLSENYHSSILDILSANQSLDPRLLTIGDRVLIPPSRHQRN